VARTGPGTEALNYPSQDTFAITIDPGTSNSGSLNGSPGALLMANGSPVNMLATPKPASVSISPASANTQFQSFSAVG
jgi:hypothetical protein